MAVATPSQQLLCFSNSTASASTTARLKPRIPYYGTFLNSRKKSNVSRIHCSSSSSSSSSSSTSQSPEASADTAETCVNLGLSLFAKGRVCKLTSQHVDSFVSSLFAKLCLRFMVLSFIQVNFAHVKYEIVVGAVDEFRLLI